MEGNKDIHSSILETVKETEMELRVMVASKRVTIGEIYNFIPGKVIEFDTMVSQPVSLVVNNKKFAEGTVVQVGDNYGCEITRVM